MRFFLRCLAYFRSDLPRILWSLALTFLATLVGLLQPFVVAVLIDSVLMGNPSGAWQSRLIQAVLPQDKVNQIIALAVIGLVITVVGAVLGMFQTMASVKVGYYGLMRVRRELFGKLQQLSLAYHRAQPQGDSIYRLSYDTAGFQTILNVVVGSILVSAVMLLVMTWMLFSTSWQLTLMSLTAVPLLMWTHRWAQRTLVREWTVAKDVEMGLTTTIQRSIASMWLTQAFSREKDEHARFGEAVQGTVLTMLRVHWREVVYGLLVATILGFGTALIVGYGGYLAYRDQIVNRGAAGGMTIGGLYFFLALLAKFYEPLNKLTGSGATLAQGAVQAKRVFEVLDREPAIRDAPNALPLPRQARTVELRDVWFEYLPDTPVLCGVSATVSPGEMVAFVGSSGVGKSTLLNLLPRFYDVTGGAILLDGHDVREVKVADLRRHVALVLQENPLMPATVAENIAYGRPDATYDDIQRAAEMSGAKTFIEALPKAYAEPLNENASNISGGQRQRIAIARALITEAPLMILDEPTSALDPHNEQMITETLRGLKRQRTIIVVSHRLSTVADCDRIYVMDAGRVVEQGAHADLIARRGVYYRMARHQMKLDDDGGQAPAPEPSEPAAATAGPVA